MSAPHAEMVPISAMCGCIPETLDPGFPVYSGGASHANSHASRRGCGGVRGMMGRLDRGSI